MEEINSSPSLLPNLTLGYLAADTCLAESATLLAAMTMVTGQKDYLANSACGPVPTVPVIVGNARTSASIVMVRHPRDV